MSAIIFPPVWADAEESILARNKHCRVDVLHAGLNLVDLVSMLQKIIFIKNIS